MRSKIMSPTAETVSVAGRPAEMTARVADSAMEAARAATGAGSGGTQRDCRRKRLGRGPRIPHEDCPGGRSEQNRPARKQRGCAGTSAARSPRVANLGS